jgi:pimeloyl-ACP methyl ester carboxylesterase
MVAALFTRDGTLARRYPPRVASAELDRWAARGQRIRIVDVSVFALQDGPAAGEALLVLHGFPTSSLDFRLALPHLAAHHRVVLHDHVGFGLSDKPADFAYSLMEQADHAQAVWRALGIRAGHVIAHDYGTSVATELLARRERGLLDLELRSLTLCNGSIHLDLARPRLTQKLLRGRLGPLFARVLGQAVFKAQLRRIFGRPDAVPEAELDLLWEALERDGGRFRLPALSSYQDERVRFRRRWIGALTRLDVPTHVLWGRRDPIARPEVAHALAAEIPGARLTWLDDLGHYPMVEDPRRWAEALLAFGPLGGIA